MCKTINKNKELQCRKQNNLHHLMVCAFSSGEYIRNMQLS